MANDATLNGHHVPRPRPEPALHTTTGQHHRYLRVQHSRPRPGLHVCALIGEIDLCSAPVLQRALTAPEIRTVQLLVVDLSRVEFLAAVGVSTLLAAAHRHRSFAVVPGSAQIRRVLNLTEASRRLTSYRSVSDAVSAYASCASSSRRSDHG